MSLKNKFQILGATVLVVVLLLTSLLAYCQILNRRILRRSELIGQIQILSLENRRREKDFLLRKDLKYQDDVQRQSRVILNLITALRQDLGLDPVESDDSEPPEGVPGSGSASPPREPSARVVLQCVEDDIKQYARGFDEVVGLFYKRGLNEVAGLRGELRESVHAIEKMLDDIGDRDLLVQMLQLRRREKDYLIRLNVKHIDKLNAEYQTFRSILARSPVDQTSRDTITQLADTYITAMRHIVELDGQIQERTDEFRNVIHKVEPDLIKLGEIIAEHNQRRTRTIIYVMSTAGLLALAIAAALVVIILRSVVQPYSRLERVILSGARGEFSDRFDLVGAEKASGPGAAAEPESPETLSDHDGMAKLGRQIDLLMKTADLFHRKVDRLAKGKLDAAVLTESLPGGLDESIEQLGLKLRKSATGADVPLQSKRLGQALASNMQTIMDATFRRSHRIFRQIVERQTDDNSLVEPLEDISSLLKAVSSQAEMLARLLRKDES